MNDQNRSTKPLFKELNGHKAGVYVVKFSKDGGYIMSGSQDKTVKLWNPNNGLLIKSYESHGHDVLDLSITQDNTKFSSVGIDKQVFLTDSIKGSTIRRYYGHTGTINTVSFNSNESVLASGSYDCTVRLWDTKSQSSEPIQTLSQAKDSITKLIILQDKVITASVDGSIRLYDIRMGQYQSDQFDFTINGFDVSLDEKYFIISGLDNAIRLFDITNGEIVNVYKGLHQSEKYSMTVKYNKSFDGFYSTSENGDIVYYDILEKNSKVFKGHGKASCGFDVHPIHENMFVSSGFDSKILNWNIKI